MSVADFQIDLPADPTFEQTAISFAFLGPGTYGAVAALDPEDFHFATFREAWGVIAAIGSAGRVPEPAMIASELEAMKLDGNEKRFTTLGDLGGGYLKNERTQITSTGLPSLDRALAGGFHRNRVYGISGLMKSGKTMLKTSISYNMVANGDAHAYLCLEMRPEEIGQRYYARHMGVNALSFYDNSQRNDPKFVQKLIRAQQYFKESGALSFRKKPRMDLETLRSTIAQIGLSGKYQGVFVDYLQLVGGQRSGQNETGHLDNVAQTLAEMAATYPIWICVGAQQNDEGGVRGGKGLAAACDVLFGFDNSDPETGFADASGRRERRHLNMQFSRYTPATDIGSVDNPAFILENKSGPYFKEC